MVGVISLAEVSLQWGQNIYEVSFTNNFPEISCQTIEAVINKQEKLEGKDEVIFDRLQYKGKLKV